LGAQKDDSKKKKKRDRKEGLLDLLEKGKTKNMEGLRRSCSFFFLIFFYQLLLFFLKKKISHVIDSIKFSKIIPQMLSVTSVQEITCN
jgi:hypothetical protein